MPERARRAAALDRVDQFVEVDGHGQPELQAPGGSDGRHLGAVAARRSAPRGLGKEAPRDLRLVEDGRAILADYLALVREAASEALAADDIPPRIAERLRSVVASSEDSVREALLLMDRGQMKFEPTSVPTVLRTAKALVEELAAEHEIHLQLEVEEEESAP